MWRECGCGESADVRECWCEESVENARTPFLYI